MWAPAWTGRPDDLVALICFETGRAVEWYERGMALLPLLDKRSRACTAAMTADWLASSAAPRHFIEWCATAVRWTATSKGSSSANRCRKVCESSDGAVGEQPLRPSLEESTDVCLFGSWFASNAVRSFGPSISCVPRRGVGSPSEGRSPGNRDAAER